MHKRKKKHNIKDIIQKLCLINITISNIFDKMSKTCMKQHFSLGVSAKIINKISLATVICFEICFIHKLTLAPWDLNHIEISDKLWNVAGQ